MKLNELPVGSLVKDTYGVGTYYNAEPIIWRVLEHGHTGDPTGSTALECRDIISLKCFDAKEPNNSDNNRKNYGNNRYLYSNLLQWSNSDATTNWYTAQHAADHEPSSGYVMDNDNPYDTEAGFLTNFSTYLKEALMTVSKTTAVPTVDGGGSEIVSSKVWYLSATEVGLSSGLTEGSIYSLYSSDSTKKVKNLANEAAKGTYLSATSPWSWWLRTYYSSYNHGVLVVNTDGTLTNAGARNGHLGLSPAICIPSDLEVALDTTDNVYYIVWPTVPDIKKIYVNNNGVTKCIEDRDLIHPFATATDAQLKAMLDAYYADEITWAEMGWNVGDTRLIHLNEMTAPNPYSGTWDAQDITIVIVAHDHNDLATAINGHTKACITVQTRECMNNESAAYHSSTDTLNGHIYVNGDSDKDKSFTKWSSLYMRTYMNNTVLGAFSYSKDSSGTAIGSGTSFKNIIKQSKHYRHTTYNGTESEQVTDTLFLPSYPELFGTASYSNYVATSPVEGTQFDYYATSANRVKQGNNNGVANGTAQYWWEGSASSIYASSYGYYWCSVYTDGSAANRGGSYAYGLAPAFAM